MRKKLLLLAFLVTGVLVQAQDVTSGIRVGLNISNLDFEPHPEFENAHRNGFAIGAFVNYPLSEKVSLMPELVYSAEGGKAKELRANYIQLPVTLRFHFGNLSVGVGPQANLKVWEYEDGYKNLILSGVGGLQYDISDTFFLDARFNYGFTNILEDNPAGIEAKNSTIQVGFGLKI
ncbi:porin family protein [Oceanihabitans sediminis]|uniref:PorT family protein n=1 Tax=Oceanihabitans sediminis TaxID=1812012 RepID=A0A368P5F3_9FLAO|nr:porin family protein [Oceanihabitans sediminis]MDX1278232.1 porin family protein [Oceanihabitans sediminis]MDX1773737.1 porin family protein [Oceanihabitans sediminis]RBP33182.1 outer membrane protein with beta-barrel domain [Oceanihabitans sediminis]RCU57314.1 PorT family protein [Oceanihabitans sediminis]